MKPVIGIDLDGTILDCRTRQEAVLLELVPEASAVADEIWALKREGLSTKAAVARTNLACPEDFDKRWISTIESEAFLRLDAPLPGAVEALAALKSLARLHLITARRNHAGLHATLQRLDLVVHFDEIVVVPSGLGAAERKAGHLRASRALGICGDTEVDGTAAYEAGVAFWAVTSGQRSAGFLAERTSPDFLTESLGEFAAAAPQILANMQGS